MKFGDDEWLAQARGYTPGTFKLELMLTSPRSKRSRVGPSVGWAGDDAVLSTDKRTDEALVRRGVKVHWRTDGSRVTVTVDYEGRGRRQIQATAGDLGEWSGLIDDVLRMTDDAEEVMPG